MSRAPGHPWASRSLVPPIKKKKKGLFFRGVLAHSKIKQEVQRIPIYPLPTAHTASPTISIKNHSAARVTTDESTLTQFYNVNTSLSPKSLVYIKFHPGRCPLYGLGQMYNDLHYRITWNSLTAGEISPCSTYPPLLPSQLLATTDLFTVIIVVPFPENHTAGTMPYGAFRTDCFHLVMDT